MESLKDLRIALIGGGNMGRGLIGGLLARGLPPAQITVADLHVEGLADLQRLYGVTTTTDNRVAVQGAQVVVLAVKPQQMAAVVTALQPALATTHPVLLSVAAGLRVADLARWAGPGVAVVRAMPNRPALVGAGASGLFADATVSAPQRELAERVMAATGLCVWVDEESQLDLVTALSGSGPAYFFLLAELMAEAAIARGMSAATARRTDPGGRRAAGCSRKGHRPGAHARGSHLQGRHDRSGTGAVRSPGTGQDRQHGNGCCRDPQPRTGRPLRQRLGPMNALIFLIDTLVGLYVMVLLLRLLLQIVRADFRNPLARGIVQLSNPLILPLRRVLPAARQVDSASVVAVLAVLGAKVLLLFALSGIGLPEPLLFARTLAVELAQLVLQTYFYLIVVYALLSFMTPGNYSPAQALLGALCEPLLRRIRQRIPAISGLDLSPLWATIGIQALLLLLR